MKVDAPLPLDLPAPDEQLSVLDQDIDLASGETRDGKRDLQGLDHLARGGDPVDTSNLAKPKQMGAVRSQRTEQ